MKEESGTGLQLTLMNFLRIIRYHEFLKVCEQFSPYSNFNAFTVCVFSSPLFKKTVMLGTAVVNVKDILSFAYRC